MNKYSAELILYFIKNEDKKFMGERNLKVFDDVKRILKSGHKDETQKVVDIFNKNCIYQKHEYRNKPDKTYYRLGFKEETKKEAIDNIKKIYVGLFEKELTL